ncbi:hypothetical protein BC830DRAFT_1078993 [Chytriomyces sp. MP71]|nr:hypothetical protein BC830DRAFT_1078993 [Chytriomyces sp. MP71]
MLTDILFVASLLHSAMAAPIAARQANSIVLTLGADVGQNGGNGINNLQCSNGKLRATINLQASVNVNGIHDYQPMGETGFDGKSTVVTATFTVGGQPGNVVAENVFNVGTSSTNGAVWSFAPNDDGPHPGGQFTLGDCSGNTIPPVSVSFACSPVTNAAGLPNGADGGPPVPLVNGPVTVVNALPAQFNGGSNGSAPAPAPAPAPSPSSAPSPSPAPAPSPAAGNNGGVAGTAGTSIHTVNTNPGSAWCGGNNQLIIQMGTTLNVVSSGIANSACRNGPMAECGLALLQGSVTANGAPVNVVSWGGGNQVSSGNTFQVQEADDSPYVGGQLLVDVPCSYTNAAQNPKTQLATLAFAWTSLTPTVQVQDTNGNPISPPAAVVVKTA